MSREADHASRSERADMGRHRELPRLRIKGGYWVAAFWKDGRRTETSFGPTSRPREDAAVDLHRLVADLASHESGDPWLKKRPSVIPTIRAAVDEYVSELKNGGSVSKLQTAKIVGYLRHLDRFGDWNIPDFGMRAYISVVSDVVNHFVEHLGSPLTRSGVSGRLNCLHRFFTWAVSSEYTSAETVAAMKAYRVPESMKKDLSGNRQKHLVTDQEFEATAAHFRPPYDSIFRLLKLTGARPSEICCIRPVDIEQSGEDVWIYRPQSHKTKHLGKHRAVALNAAAIQIVKGFLAGRNPEDYLFRPCEYPLPAGYKGTAPAKYIVRQLIAHLNKAHSRAGTTPWTTYDLRRTAATRINRALGMDAARAILGHSDAATTDGYVMTDTQHLVELTKKLADQPPVTGSLAPATHDVP